MKSMTLATALLLVGCGSDESSPSGSSGSEAAAPSEVSSLPSPAPDSVTPTALPEAGRRIRLTTAPGGEFDGDRLMDVAEVSGVRVRLREPLCEHQNPGVWVDWRKVLEWVDVGEAVGDDWALVAPVDEEGMPDLDSDE